MTLIFSLFYKSKGKKDKNMAMKWNKKTSHIYSKLGILESETEQCRS